MSRQVFSTIKEEKPPRSPLWYNGAMEDSDPEDSPSHFDLLAAALTPLRVCTDKNSVFASPTKRLDNLRLSPHKQSSLRQQKPIEIFQDSIELLQKHQDLDGTDINGTALDADTEVSRENTEEFDIRIAPEDSGLEGLSPADLADQTIVEESSSGDDEPQQLFSHHRLLPIFIRKRKHTESPMVITPQAQARHPLSQSSFTCDMSGVVTAESANNTTFSVLKLSFSASDSTPCPPQPRKRLKFKLLLLLLVLLHNNLEDTPSQPSRVGKPVLDLSASKKLAASSVPLLTKLNHASASDQDSDEHVESTETGSSMHSSRLEPSSTPISQSTPANSRANSPSPYEEMSDTEVDGYKFVRPSTQSNFQTPINRYPVASAPTPKSQQLLNSYNSSNFSAGSGSCRYKIIGNVPVSAAGLMDENSEDVHIGDKRINDPYVSAPASSPSPGHLLLSAALLEKYSTSRDKLPLLEHFQRDLHPSEMDDLINDGKSVWAFYKMILLARLTDLHMISFLKKERLRWHPDKWVHRIQGSGFEKSNIDNLSKVINAFIEEINNGFRDAV